MANISATMSYSLDINATDNVSFPTMIPEGMTTGQPESPADSNEEAIYAAIDFLVKYVYSFITIQGVITNVLSMLVLTRRKIAKTSVSWYLLLLALSDTLVLILDFVNNYFKEVIGIKTIGLNTGVCVMYRYAFNVLFTTSSWLVLAVTFERMLAVYLPLKVMAIASRKKAKVISLVIFIVIAVYNCFNLWVWEAKELDCDWAEGWETFHAKSYMLLTGFLYSYIPTVLIFVFNILIIYKIKQAEKNRAELQNDAKESSMESQKITMMVLAVSFAFLILTVPMSVYYIIQFSLGQFIDMTPSMALGEISMLLLGLLNHGINFWLYIFTSVSFRRALVGLLRCTDHAGRYTYSSNTQERGTKTLDLSVAGSETSLKTISSSQPKV